MPTIQEIDVAVAQLKREKKRVSLRNVRSLLPRGGSYSDIGPALAAWKKSANYEEEGVPRDLPAPLASLVEEFASRLWLAARQEAEKIVQLERLKQDRVEPEIESDAALAWAEVDRLSDENSLLHRQLFSRGILADRRSIPSRSRKAAAPSMADGVEGETGSGEPETPVWRGPRYETQGNGPYWAEVLNRCRDVFRSSGCRSLDANELLASLPDSLRNPRGRISLHPLILGRMLASWTEAQRKGFVQQCDGRFIFDPEHGTKR